MIKILGLLCLVAASGMAGIFLSFGLSKRVSELENAILLLEKMQTHLRYGHTPTDELLCRLTEQENFREMGFLKSCIAMMRQGTPFPTAWKSAIGEWREGMLKEDDKKLLAGIGDILGGSDAETQIGGLELTAQLLRQNHQEALTEKNTEGKLYRSLGILIGIGAAIFIA